MRPKILLALMLCVLVSACKEQKHPSGVRQPSKGQLTRPTEAVISLDSTLVFDQFDEGRVATLKRYFSSNPRWEIRKENRYSDASNSSEPKELTYAIQKEARNGKYETTLNGYYSDFRDEVDVMQTRVIVSFGQHYGHGNQTEHITFAKTNQSKVNTIIKAAHAGTPGNSSYIVLESKAINIEIYEQSKMLARTFTQDAIQDLNKELGMVLENLEEIDETGKSPVAAYYPAQLDSSYLEIADGMQPGIYIVKAGLRTKETGIAYVKAFNSKTNERLSAERMTPRTTRTMGWSEDGKTVFPFESDLTVYEGDWEHQYMARFEVWFRPKEGAEVKLLEKERLINGWER